MPLIEWKDEYSVKVDLFDEHHQQLVAIINQLADAMENNQTHRQLDIIFSKLIEYTQIHFDSEESLLRQQHYPAIHDQEVEHEAFVATLKDIRAEFKAGHEEIGARILDFLKHWLVNHILESDMAYSGFLNEKGVS